jgi:hypothetical protein
MKDNLDQDQTNLQIIGGHYRLFAQIQRSLLDIDQYQLLSEWVDIMKSFSLTFQKPPILLDQTYLSAFDGFVCPKDQNAVA